LIEVFFPVEKFKDEPGPNRTSMTGRSSWPGRMDAVSGSANLKLQDA
jgi:hypothetical protein